jgi:dolichol-phosphate hexosyltransferase
MSDNKVVHLGDSEASSPALSESTLSNVSESGSLRKSDVTIVIPVLNEEEAIEPVLQELIALGYHNILIADGYSSDQTPTIVKQFGVQMVQQHGMGKAGSIDTAIKLVKTPYFLVMDGDFTYDPTDIERFLAHGKDYEEIIGRRTKRNGSITRSHQFGNRVITGLFNLLLFTKLSDLCSGMYLLKTEAARQLVLSSTGFSVEAEIAAQISHEGEITEVPINYRPRVGKRKLSTWKDGTKIFTSIFRLAHDFNPVFLYSLLAALMTVPGIALLCLAAFSRLGDAQMLLSDLGLVFTLFGGQALFVGGISLLVKRSERRISRQIHALKLVSEKSSPLLHEKLILD